MFSPREFQIKQMPVQSFAKLTINQDEDGCRTSISRETEVELLKRRKSELFDQDVLNILNGQFMYEEFKNKRLMGDSDYVSFNEAMCVNGRRHLFSTMRLFKQEQQDMVSLKKITEIR